MAQMPSAEIILRVDFIYENSNEYEFIRINNNITYSQLFDKLNAKFEWKRNNDGYSIIKLKFTQYIDYESIYDPSCIRWLREANNTILFINGQIQSGTYFV